MSSPYLTDFSAGFANDHPAATGAPGKARLLSSPSGYWGSKQKQVAEQRQVPVPIQLQASEQVRYLGHWPELLADLELLGRVWVETEQPGLRMAQRRRLSGLRVHGLLGYLDTPEYQVRVLLDQCHALAPRDDEQGLVIEAADGQPLMSLQLEAGMHPLPLRLLLSSLGAKGRRLVPVPASQDEPRISALEQHAVHRLQRDCQSLEPEPADPGPGCVRPGLTGAGLNGLGHSGSRPPGLGFRDLGELSGQLSLNPVPWRQAAARGDDTAIAVDPTLVPCALETLVDQVHPLALSSGSRGWVSRSNQQFYGHAYVDGQLSLRGDETRLELDVRAIDSAWVVGERAGELDGRSLRLYDEDGRAMAIIASAGGLDDCKRIQHRAGPRRDEARLWTTLMNALTS